MMKKPKLVLCIDRDNDLYEKAGISGPIIGREANLNAAIKLGTSDPAEVDTNAIFKAISIFDRLSSAEHNVQVATLTGSSELGYAADEAISEQLDRILSEFPCDSCIFVSDGASDESILPIIQSRLKIDSVEVLVMRQAQELEKTYFVLLEKLKEPYYARMLFGVPAVLLILIVLSSVLNWGWQVPTAIVAVYLLLKAFGIEEMAIKLLSSFKFSVEKISLVLYLPAFFLMAVSFWSGYQSFIVASSIPSLNGAKIVAMALRSFLLLFPSSVLLLIAGKVIDLLNEKKSIEIIKFGLYAVFTVLFWLVFTSGANWVVNDSAPYVSFADLVLILISSAVIGFASINILQEIRRKVVMRMKLSGKEVLSSGGNYLGKILGVDTKRWALAVKSPLGQKFMVAIDSIEKVGDKVIVSH
ncbi:hypothetical protein COU37_03510 [Candidatus Micrarchaeota archaeon CG10_big_fil_rev_8_21_14_0_10_45_29]|nr:MAG: hypothetical protein COU37_03510 [Candidatus Micrarchaeota archaeon CG10_big_fil_rev_8_21_14_0_10_45_29]